MYVVERPLLRRFLQQGGRRLLYGRRKTGKTFYTRHVLRDYTYFIVRRGGEIYDPLSDETLGTGGFLRLCRLGEKLILDEFHRAEPRLFDALHAGACGDNLVLITSTLHYFRRFTEAPGAPLKGLFSTRQVPLLSPVELLAAEPPTPGATGPREKVALLTLYQEPVLIGKGLLDSLLSGREFAKSLVGEVLEEEDHAYTLRYDAVLEAIAAGRERLSEIANYLHSRGLAPPGTGAVTKYLQEMTRMGLLERIPVWGSKRRHIYRHASPLTDLIYYLHARYGFYDVPLPPDFLYRAAWQRLPLLVERMAERLLAEAHGLRPVRIIAPQEVDIALVEYQRLRIVGEVKWRSGRIEAKELRSIEQRLSAYDAERILVVPDATQVAGEAGLEIIDYEAMRALARRTIEKWETLPA